MRLVREVHKRMNLVILLLPIGIQFIGCDRKPPAPPAPMTAQVSFVTIQPQKITLTTQLPGRTSAFRVAEIRPQVSGLIQKRLFTEGADVKAGEALYQIDPAPFQVALNSAKAALHRSEATLSSVRSRAQRFKELLAVKAVSQQDYDDATAALNQAEADIQVWTAAVESANINLGYTNVTAPISGRIGKSNVTDGAVVTAYQPMPLATLQQLDPIYADAPQSTMDLLLLKNRLKDGRLQQATDENQVQLIEENGAPYPLDGTLQFSDITVDPSTGSVMLRAQFPNPDGALLPGMFIQLIVKEGINEKAMLVPQQGVSRDPKGNPYSLIVDAEGKAGFRPLTLDRTIGNQWLVSSGLAPADKVIVEGLKMLRPGTPVTAVPFQDGEAQANTTHPSPATK